jgi:hypothetical protein
MFNSNVWLCVHNYYLHRVDAHRRVMMFHLAPIAYFLQLNSTTLCREALNLLPCAYAPLYSVDVLFTFVSPNSRTFLTEAQGLVCVEGDIHMILMYCICCLLRFSKLGGILWLYIGGEHHSRFQRAFDMVQ